MAGFNIISVVGEDPREAAGLFPELDLSSPLRGIITDEVSRIAVLGRAAAQSEVPVRTQELRDAIKVQGSPLDKEVYIESTIHESSRTRLKLNNPTLAEILDEGFSQKITHPDVIRPPRANTSGGQFKRSRSSIGVVPFYAVLKGQPTAGWISLAREATIQAMEQ